MVGDAVAGGWWDQAALRPVVGLGQQEVNVRDGLQCLGVEPKSAGDAEFPVRLDAATAVAAGKGSGGCLHR